MNEESKRYYERADELRAIADTYTTLECRRQMFALAREYDERAERLGHAPHYPCGATLKP